MLRVERAVVYLALFLLGLNALIGRTPLPRAEAGEPPSTVLKARGLVVVDSEGRPRIELFSEDKPDSAGVLIYDQGGKVRAGFVVRGDGESGIEFSEAEGKTRLGLSVRSDGSTALAMGGKDGVARVLVASLPGGNPTVGLMGGDGEPLVDLSAGPDGSELRFRTGERLRAAFGVRGGHPALRLADSKGKQRAGLLLADDLPGLYFLDEDENPQAQFAIPMSGTASLQITEKDGTATALVAAVRGGSGMMSLGDPKGKEVWRAPNR